MNSLDYEPKYGGYFRQSLLDNNIMHVDGLQQKLESMKNGVFWDVTPCGSCKNRSFGGTWRLLHQVDQKSVN
jgi:hypothetical protein